MNTQRAKLLIAGAASCALMACVLAGCGQQNTERDGVPAADGEAIELALGEGLASGPCAAADPILSLACGDPTLTASAEALSKALQEDARRLSPEGLRLLQQGALEWVGAQRAACGAPEDAAPGPEVVTCLEAAIADRLSKADDTLIEAGGYTIQRVEVLRALPVTPAIAEASGLGEGAPKAMIQAIAYPRIDSPRKAPAAQRFNEAAEQRPTDSDSPLEETIDFKIAYASPEIISVRFDTYEYALGAAHPNNGMRAVTILMRTGAPIGPQDVFTAGSGWEAFISERATRELSSVFEEFGAGPPEPSDVRDTATKTHNWVIGEGGLTVLFPPYSVGPHALGPQEVTIPWSELRPYLNARAPAPVGQG